MATDDLTVLIEKDVVDLDMYANLSEEKGEVEGVTDFYPGKKPKVRISKLISEARHLENRLRTTLTHEYGHVRFHNFMFAISLDRKPLFPTQTSSYTNQCKREKILNANRSDWMEWQAVYASGALLMPIGALRETVHAFMVRDKISAPRLGADSPDGQRLISEVSRSFQVSNDAARVRLFQQRFLVERGSSLSGILFK